MPADLEGKRVVVTGGTGSLGGAVVDDLRSRGATVHVPSYGGNVPATWSADDHIVVTADVDLRDEQGVADYYASLPSLWGSIHAAGGFSMAPITETSLAELRGQHDINAVTAFLCCREAVRKIRDSGTGGRLVNVAARPALSPVGGLTAYSMAKAAVAALTRGLAVELSSEEILVNAVVPSLFDSPQNRAAMPDANHDAWPKPVQIARAISALVSPHNELTSGALVPVYGTQ